MHPNAIHQLLGEHYPQGFVLLALNEDGEPVLQNEYPNTAGALALVELGKSYFRAREESLGEIIRREFE